MAAGVLLAGGLILAGCAGGDDPGHGPADGGHMAAMQEPPEGSIRVGLRNWAVEPSVASVRAGKVTFWAVHEMEPHPHDGGGEIHDLQVLRKAADGSFELVGEVRDLAMGEAAALALELAPGEYELACTVVEEVNGEAVSHYEKGMRTPFVVTPS
jgi:uncharacterized cupredoxin-like copper-binding protein